MWLENGKEILCLGVTFYINNKNFHLGLRMSWTNDPRTPYRHSSSSSLPLF